MTDSANTLVRRRRLMLVFLTLALLISHLDRHILAVALEQIKIEFALSDTQLGILSGLPFAVVFVLFGFLSARFSRPGRYKPMIVVALIVWSVAAMAMGLAGSFMALLIFRVIVGGGEATAVPPTHALIAQAYPPSRRASALAVLQTGASLGLFLAFAGGGLVIALFGWRVGFVVFGLLGVILAVPLALWMTEAQDTAPQPVGAATQQRGTIAQVFRVIWADPSSRLVVLGLVMATVVATAAWRGSRPICAASTICHCRR